MKFEKVKMAVAAAVVAFGVGGAAQKAEAATACSDINPGSISYADFTSCTVIPERGNIQDTFSNIKEIVDRIFDPAVTLDADGSFTPGQGGGEEFKASSPDDGFVIDTALTGNTSFTFSSLPENTIFISFKQGNAFELARVPQALLDGSVSSFVLGHHLAGGSTSHISTVAGVAPDHTTPIPLPAAAWMLMAGLGGLGAVARRKRRATA